MKFGYKITYKESILLKHMRRSRIGEEEELYLKCSLHKASTNLKKISEEHLPFG
jgi:hypothetical protein